MDRFNQHSSYDEGRATPFQLDEGFSEDTSSQNGASRMAALQEYIGSLSEESRMEIAYEILQTLRATNIATVVERLRPFLHMDPLEKLPPEVTAQIFEHLDAPTLLTASLASQTWRGRILDSELWKRLFAGQGWGTDARQLKAYNEFQEHMKSRKGKTRVLEDSGGQPQLKKRATADLMDSRGRLSADVSHWREQHGRVEADTDAQSQSSDQEMPDVTSSQSSPSRPNKRHSRDSGDEMDGLQLNSSTLAQVSRLRSASDMAQRIKPRLTIPDPKGNERLNWAFLYKQRQRLEENWTKGRFVNFQLPDPAYPHEAHTECVYTIQFVGKWLVSGSRDKTLRVWDLETRRLRGRPLTGHSQSVLCLQFDPSPEEDIIISGSSDASVIMWKFSTGQKLHEIPSAHDESVLNLRFDHRYLVTCSKDKKIRVWNRHALSPVSPDCPRIASTSDAFRVPSQIVDWASQEPSMLEARLAAGTIKSLPPYQQLMTFVGHGAAVNAIQINGDLIVSASGDRLIKVWNVKTGKMMRSLPGHTKGIACVQFDSKRIVSGSSDNTVRIFDPYTGTEVAELIGHANLVRTVQAGFGDLPGSEDEDIMRVRAAEQKYAEDLDNRRLPNSRLYSRQLRNGELGTSRVAFGSRLPPGGGGSKWGKIVSGSYDESIIIWRKNVSGDWVVGLTLRQDDAVRVARRGGRPGATNGAVVNALLPVQPPVVQTNQPPQAVFSNQNGLTHQASQGPAGAAAPATANAAAIMQAAVNVTVSSGFASLGAGLGNIVGAARNLQNRAVVPPRSSSGRSQQSNASTSASAGPGFGGVASAMVNPLAQAMQQQIQETHAQPHAQPQPQQILGGPPNPGWPLGAQNHPQIHQQNANGPQGQLNPQAAQVPPVAPGAPQGAPNHHAATVQQGQAQPPQQNQNAHGHQQGQQQQQGGSVARVFKLQFDARRIVCCSQDSRIIGWDFANGDKEIEEGCRFFVGP